MHLFGSLTKNYVNFAMTRTSLEKMALHTYEFSKNSFCSYNPDYNTGKCSAISQCDYRWQLIYCLFHKEKRYLFFCCIHYTDYTCAYIHHYRICIYTCARASISRSTYTIFWQCKADKHTSLFYFRTCTEGLWREIE